MMTNAVPEADLSPVHAGCPVCLHAKTTPAGLTLQESPPVELLECGRCNVVFASRFPQADFLTQLYHPDNYEPDLNGNPKATAALAGRLCGLMAEHAQPRNGRALRILDYGGADGTLMAAIVKELPSRFDRDATQFVVADLFPQTLPAPLTYQTVDELFATAEPFDVILASAVVEHLPDVRDALMRLDGLLAPGGLFYARTPWELPLAKLSDRYPSRWPRHLFDMGPAFWQNFGTTVLDGYELCHSATSLPDSDFNNASVRTAAAYVLKGVQQIEAATVQKALRYDLPFWRWVGSWEAMFQKSGTKSP